MLLLLSLEGHTWACAHTNTHNLGNVSRRFECQGFPFVLACSQGCSWIWMWSCMQGDPEDNIVGPFYCWEANYLSLSCAQPKHIMWCMWHIKSFSLAGIHKNRMLHWANSSCCLDKNYHFWCFLFFFFLGRSLISHCACMQFLFWFGFWLVRCIWFSKLEIQVQGAFQ